MKAKFKKTAPWAIFWVILSIAFLSSTVYIVLISHGYKINFITKKIQKTGILSVKSTPKNVDVLINDQLKSSKTPYDENYIFPGSYLLVLKRDNYQTWQKTINIEQGKVSENKVILFYNQPKIEPVTDENTKRLLDQNPDSNGILIKDSEIWQDDKLITRFSQKVDQAILYLDEGRIIFKIANEIRVIDIDGSNDIKLISGKNLGKFILTNNGKTIIFSDEGQIYQATVR